MECDVEHKYSHARILLAENGIFISEKSGDLFKSSYLVNRPLWLINAVRNNEYLGGVEDIFIIHFKLGFYRLSFSLTFITVRTSRRFTPNCKPPSSAVPYTSAA